MSLATVQAADFVKIHTDLGSPTVTWSGSSYRAIPGGGASSKRADVGGFELVADFVVKLLKTDFNSGSGPFPTAQQTLISSGNTYRIEKVITNESGVFLRLECMHANRGA